MLIVNSYVRRRSRLAFRDAGALMSNVDGYNAARYRITPFGRAVAQAEVARLTTLLRQAEAVGLTPGRA
jgi:hypothetical protein